MKSLRVIFFGSLLAITPSIAMENYKENLPPLNGTIRQQGTQKVLSESLRTIRVAIQKGHETFDGHAIKSAWENFQQLEADESQWQDIATEIQANSWPSQETWRDVVGGHLFFPPRTIDWDSEDLESYLLERIDNLFSLFVAAKYNHSIAKFYFAKTISKLNLSNVSDLCERLLQQSYNDFLACGDNQKVRYQDVCYIIGSTSTKHPNFSQHYIPQNFYERSWQNKWWCKENPANLDESDMACHIKCKDLRNVRAVLDLRRIFLAIYHPPSEKDYRDLVQVRFAAKLTEDPQKKEVLLKEAIGDGDAIAWVELGDLYIEMKRGDEAKECYQKAGAAGILEGYIRLGTSYVSDPKSDYIMKQYPLKTCPEEARNKAIQAFQIAGQLGHFQGYDYLAALYIQLFKQGLIKDEVVQPLLSEALEQGIKLGSIYSYDQAYKYELEMNESITSNFEDLFEYIQYYK